MDLTGQWETAFDTSAQYRLDLSSYLQLSDDDGFFIQDEFYLDPTSPDFEPSGEVSHSLTLTALVADGTTYGIASGVQSAFYDSGFSGSITGEAALDGLLSHSPGEGVRLEFVDPAFLMAPVPLPAGWLLLIGGVGAAWSLRRPKRPV
jgi:hypothetical protein